MKVLAPAKINVYLSVGARRPDGLHELVSVMQAVGLYDELDVSADDAFSLTVSPAGAVPIEGNLVLRAAKTFAALQGVAAGATFALTKRIPVAAGLAGGSADAAATLVGLNALWDTAVSRKALEKIGAGLGADVPFCVRGGTAAVRGAGEDLAVLSSQTIWWVIAKPATSLATADVYAEFDRLGGGSLGDPFEVADSLARRDLDRLASAMRNDLEAAALSLSPDIAFGRDALLSAGAVHAMISGSGPTWLGLARSEDHATAIAAAALDQFEQVHVAPSLTHGPRVSRA